MISQRQGKVEEEHLDFFDTDDHGFIVLQPKIPMFPEDFTSSMEPKAWPLSVSTLFIFKQATHPYIYEHAMILSLHSS
jgi:hypothetical protein